MSVPEHIGGITPGRICLFGEHQDILGLPVIVCAVELAMEIVGQARWGVVHIGDVTSEDLQGVAEKVPSLSAHKKLLLLHHQWRQHHDQRKLCEGSF